MIDQLPLNNVISLYEKLLNTALDKDIKLIQSPFRDETKASFAIYRTNGRWYDYGEQSGGDIYELYKRLQNVDFPTAKRAINDMLGISSPEINKNNKNIITKTEYKKYLHNFEKKRPEFLFERWKKRKIDEFQLKRLEVGTKERNGAFGGSFFLPFQKDQAGNIILAKEIYWYKREKRQRWVHKKNIKGIAQILGINDEIFKKSETIVICEGEEDYLTLISNGIAAASGTNGAKYFKKDWIKYFLNKNVIINFDADETGDAAAESVAELLSGTAETIKILKFEDVKRGYDVGDFFTENNLADYLKLLETAQTFVPKKKLKEQIEIQNEETFKNKYLDLFYKYNERSDKYTLLHDAVAEYIAENYEVIASDENNSKVKYYEYYDGLYNIMSQFEINKIIDRLLVISYTDSQVRSIRMILTHKIYVRNEKFNNYPELLNLKNCIFDLTNYKPLKKSSKYYFTYQNEYEYNDAATCPKFDEALKKYSLNDKNWIKNFWEIAGYVLTGKYEIQKMFWFTGSQGGNGKGTITRVLQKLVGFELTKPNFLADKLSENFYKKSLIGKRLAIAGDMPPFMTNIATIKELTGGDIQSTDVKYSDAVNFENTAKLVFSMNQMPVFPSNEPFRPILRRINLLPFDYVITEYDIDIEKEFEKELSGIFNKAIAGLRRLRQNKKFTKVERSEKILKSWTGEYNNFNSFIEQKIVFEKTAEIWNYDLFSIYIEYMNEINGDNWTLRRGNITSLNKFTEKLRLAAAERGAYFNKRSEYSNEKQRVCARYIGVREMTISDFIQQTGKEQVQEYDDNVPF